MSSLLDGIDVAEKTTGPQRSGPNAKLIKVAVACVLFVAAGVFVGMQAGLIPSPFASNRGTAMHAPFVQSPSAELAETVEQLRREEEQFIAGGGKIGDS